MPKIPERHPYVKNNPIAGIKNPNAIYTIQEYQKTHGISRQTARKDLLKITAKKLLHQRKIGRSVIFVSPSDLKQKLSKLNNA